VTEHSSEFGYSGISDRALRRARIAFRRADLVAPVSEYLRGQIEAHGIHVPFTVVPNAVDTDQFSPAGERATPARIVVVAAQIPLKGIDHLLRAVGTVAERRRDFAVDIVGDGPSRPEYEALAGELGIADLVVFHGRREKDDVVATLRRGRFLVLPSLTENLPVSIIEAMACGLPVVASDVGGIRELVDEGTGVLVPPADPRALGTALDSMLDHHGDYDADAIARRARDRFSLPVIGDTWDRLYREVLAQRRAPRDARHPRRGT
jgi:glycosyltransferase involved in cell wall biosynthesis